MKKNSNKRIVFSARKLGWYSDLIKKLEENWIVDRFEVHYFFELNDNPNIKIVLDSIFLLFYFPVVYLYKGRGLYIMTTRHLPFLFWFRVLSLMGLQRKLIAMNFYFHTLRENKYIAIILRFLINNENLTIIASSRNDCRYFRALSEKVNLDYVPYCIGRTFEKYKVHEGDYIFCGGFNNRDFNLVVKIAKEIDERFLIIASGKEKISDRSSNVEILRDVDQETFHTFLARSKLVIIPLRYDTGASGQMVTLASMRLGKPIVFTDYDVIAEYFIDGVNGLAYEAGNKEDLREKVLKLINDPDLRRVLGRNAKEYCEKKFTRGALNRRIVKIIERTLT